MWGLCFKTAALRCTSKDVGLTVFQCLGLSFTELSHVTVTGQCHIHCSLVFVFSERVCGWSRELCGPQGLADQVKARMEQGERKRWRCGWLKSPETV